MYLCQALFIAVYLRLWKEGKMLVELRQGLRVVTTQVDLLPEILRRMRALYGLYVKMYPTVLLPDSGILGVGEGATRTIAETSGRVGMLAKLLLIAISTLRLCHRRLVRAELVIYHLPYHFVVLHGSFVGVLLFALALPSKR